ncbi:condensin subunit Smc [Thiothrix eikelboomii]|uniref:Chromosome partition protein Smc n=1 Tax=Thiothrix eikelboomii TaxID=92487 RepID=A0A1T4XQT5_9GAMM|nr:chromosome segregation protein SMC [Thiothrix eikelboomii]SKA91900.1 condensin subunit Smc [Thiothrix eikelboomii]
MRLSKIRLAGFKSFVDPVTLNLPSNLVGILGPNGCGKSNTIDAVRWVMGESSARNLRGQAMEDVIFNGSSARKPVGLASVELVFDNTAAQLAGPYASYAEIAIKRQVGRDGSSKFFLNGSRCRRRDITDLFLGTGLGSRSYAIIEQGMIARLIEAKPEELRASLEEAAGISRYKERRRETETRITHTRDNLARLADLREELAKQLQKLDKQAKTAERFRALREEQKRLDALHLAAQLQALTQTAEPLLADLKQSTQEQQASLTEIQQITAQLEALRTQFSQATEALNLAQAHYYAAGANLGRLEQNLQHQQATQQRHQEQLIRLEQSLAESLTQQTEDQAQLQTKILQLEQLRPAAATLEEQLAQAEASVLATEHLALALQEQWQQLQQALAQPLRQLHSETARIEQLERQTQASQPRRDRLQQALAALEQDDFTAQQQGLMLELATTTAKQTFNQEQLEALNLQLQTQRQQQQQITQQIEQQRRQLSNLQGQLTAANTLQQAALKQDQPAYQGWLQSQALDQYPRLATELQVVSGWEPAVEVVLAKHLTALGVEQLADITLENLPETGLALIETNREASAKPLALNPASLAHQILAPQHAQSLAQHALCSPDLATALAQREQLTPPEFYITPNGSCVGKHWLQTPSQSATGHVLERQQTLRNLQTQIEPLQLALAQMEAAQQALDLQNRDLEQTQGQAQLASKQLQQQEFALSKQLQQIQQQQAQQQQRQQQLYTELHELAEQQTQQTLDLASALERKASAELTSLSLQAEQTNLRLKKDQQQQSLQNLRSQARHLNTQQQKLTLTLHTVQTEQQHIQQQLERGQIRLTRLQAQQAQVLTELAQQTESLMALHTHLATAKAQRLEAEQALQLARQQTQQLEQQIRTQEQQRLQCTAHLERTREQLATLQLAWQTQQVQTQHLQEQFALTGFELAALTQTLAQYPNLEAIRQDLAKTSANIERLGAINLAAIEEYREQSERKTYLDQQNADLVLALETLATAMHTIDRETRARFKETFDLVNQRLQEMFPRLFGGGECYLAMTEQDLLKSGVNIMARPPGKRLSSIQLMSGGEKALTAVALVFAIFALNPAPFCILDEVDAPLDEANVGRFCELVKQMSEQVQFIFITHNKTTMELAENLIGVTMREAGVSRLVSVDMAQALELVSE